MTISGSSFFCAPLPIFDGRDYNLWQKKMKTFFMSQDLWNLVQNGKTLTALTAHEQQIHEDERKDLLALYYIQQAVTPTIFSKFVSASSAKTAWDFLEKEYNLWTFLEGLDFDTIKISENLYPPIWLENTLIFKIPKELRELNPAAYTPQLISIGPYFHGRPELANMQKYKLYYAKNFLDRIQKPKDLFVCFIVQHEQSIRRCYKYSDLVSKDYVQMILLDSFFIFEFFLRCGEKYYNLDDSLVHEPLLRNNILVDLMLVENQLPLSLLFELYNIGSDTDTYFFCRCLENFKVFNTEQTRLDDEEVMKQLNFTCLIRRFKSSGISEDMKEWDSILTLNSAAKKLSESKVKFSGIVGGSLIDIRFENRVLILPKFKVDNTTERVYTNLMGLEQCDDRFNRRTYICSYILLMQLLCQTSDDVAVLVEEGVIFNELGSNQAVVDIFNRLCKSIWSSPYGMPFYFSDLRAELDGYCSSWKGWRNYCRKSLKDVYFTNIWTGTGTVAAVILLLLTLTQTITSIMQVT